MSVASTASQRQQQRRAHPFALHSGEEPGANLLRREWKPVARQADHPVAVVIGLATFGEEHLESGEQQKSAKQVDDLFKMLEERNAAGDERAPKNERADDSRK